MTETRYRQAIGKAQELRTPSWCCTRAFCRWYMIQNGLWERSVIFWRRLIREVPEGLTVCLENVLEPEGRRC